MASAAVANGGGSGDYQDSWCGLAFLVSSTTVFLFFVALFFGLLTIGIQLVVVVRYFINEKAFHPFIEEPTRSKSGGITPEIF